MEPESPTHQTLHRALGPLEVVFLVFSALSPAMSVFIYGDGVLRMAGTGAVAAVLIGGLIAAGGGEFFCAVGGGLSPGRGGFSPPGGGLRPVWGGSYITNM